MSCKQISHCIHCSSDFCERCSMGSCYVCGDDTVCEDCLKECPECGEQTCPECLGTDMCDNCKEEKEEECQE